MTDTITVNIGKDKTVDLKRFFEPNSIDVADSIEAVQKTPGLIRLPSYGIAIAKALDSGDDLWTNGHDVLAEQIRATATKSYKDVTKGDHRIFVVGASIFSHDPDAIKSFVKREGVLDGRENVGLTNHSVPLSQTSQIDRLLGDRIVYVTGSDGVPREQIVDRIMTYDQFFEASKDKKFLAKHRFYLVQFPEQDINSMKSGYFSIDAPEVRGHQTSIVQSGGARIWQAMLNAGKSRKYSHFYVGNSNLNQNSGSVVIAYFSYNGFRTYHMDRSGRSLGVAPEVLDALVDASKDLQIHRKDVLDIASKIRGLPEAELKKYEVLESIIENFIQ